MGMNEVCLGRGGLCRRVQRDVGHACTTSHTPRQKALHDPVLHSTALHNPPRNPSHCI